MCDGDLFFQITHEKLQGDVVHEDVIQWDNAQLAKVGCQLQGVHLLHTGKQKSAKGTGKTESWSRVQGTERHSGTRFKQVQLVFAEHML